MAAIFRHILNGPIIKQSPIALKHAQYNSHRFASTNDSKEKSAAATSTTKTYTKALLEQLVKTNKVVIFMKGNPEQPRCGFSNAVVQILRMHGVQYDAHDVLQSDELRQSEYILNFLLSNKPMTTPIIVCRH